MSETSNDTGRILLAGLLLALWPFVFGCDDKDSGRSKDPVPTGSEENVEIPPDDDNEEEAEQERPIVACGDSITTGEQNPDVDSYPERVADMKDRTVINKGRGGERATRAAFRIDSILGSDPEVVLILYGTNDVRGGWDLDEAKEGLRTIIRAVKDIDALPVIGTIPPMTGDMEWLMPDVDYMNGLIWELAEEEGAVLVDIAGEFGTGEGLMLPDGFHPNDAGTQVIAFAFAEAF